MKKTTRAALTLLITAGLMLPAAAFASNWHGCGLSGPVPNAGKHFKNKMNVKVWVKYYNTAGHTVVDPTGIYWYIKGQGVKKGAQKYPKKYWGDCYDLYMVGSKMTYSVHIWNKRKRAYNNLRVLATQELLNPKGHDGEDMGGCSTAEWQVKKIAGKRVWCGVASYLIAGGTPSGLDQTHVKIQQWKKAKHWWMCGGSLLYDNPQAGIFCPPED